MYKENENPEGGSAETKCRLQLAYKGHTRRSGLLGEGVRPKVKQKEESQDMHARTA